MEQEKDLKLSSSLSIHYRVNTPGQTAPGMPTLVLIHGVASNLTRWTEFLTNTRLRSRCRIIRLDLRGHARSQTDIGVGMKNWCLDLIAILDREQIEKATIVGHSLGAQVALNLAYRFPQRVTGLVLIDPVIPSALTGFLAIGPYVRWLLGAISIAATWLRRLFYRGHTFPLRDLYELDQKTRKQIETDPTADLAELYHSPSADVRHISIGNYVRDMCEVLRPLPPLTGILAPTLAILAKNPSVSDGARNRKTMAELPRVTIATVDADHWPLTEKPDETREAIEQWCLDQWDKP